MSLIQPAINAFALMTLGVPAVILLIHELRRFACVNVTNIRKYLNNCVYFQREQYQDS